MEGILVATYRCNARCHMCNTWQFPSTPEQEMAPSYYEKFPELEFLNITGGAPCDREGGDHPWGDQPSLCGDEPGEVSPEALRVLLSSWRPGEPDQGDEPRIKSGGVDELPEVSCQPVSASLLHTAACVLMGTLQEALEGTHWSKAQVGTIVIRPLKVGSRVVETCRKIWFHLPKSFLEKEAWARAHRRLVSGMT
jgi:hypothetical protein